MISPSLKRILTYFIALVWFANGLLCKVLNLVPRHEEIVARILGQDYSRPITLTIGLAEIGMGLWYLSGYKRRFNAVLQIAIVALMNCIEFIFAADLLLWGKLNIFFAFLFVLLVYINDLHPYKNKD